MMYSYIVLEDETEITHSHIIDRDGEKTVEVHFERPKGGGFDSARCVLPAHQWLFQDGFAKDEISFFEEFLRNNAELLYRFAERGGIFAEDGEAADDAFCRSLYEEYLADKDNGETVSFEEAAKILGVSISEKREVSTT